MRLLIALFLCCCFAQVASRAAGDSDEAKALRSGTISVVCYGKVIDIDGVQTLQLKIPLPGRLNKHITRYTDKTGQERTMARHSWEIDLKERSIPMGDVNVLSINGDHLDPEIARKRLSKRKTIVFGHFPSVAARTILRRNTLVVLPKDGVAIDGFPGYSVAEKR